MMRFLADENVDFPVITILRQHGYDIRSVLEEFPSIDDDFVLNLANKDNRILITLDKDFGELVFRLHKIHQGVVLLRMDELPSEEKAKVLLQIFKERGAELTKAFSVVTDKFVRIRK